MTGVEITLITVPTPEVARTLAEALVGEGLVACVNIIPGVTSIYRWKGAVEEDGELLLLAKGGTRRRAEVEARVRELHPYEEPEILVLDVTDGSHTYLTWVLRESGASSRE